MAAKTVAPLRLGVAGLGTVGAGVVKIIEKHKDLMVARAGRPIEIIAVSARDVSKDRGFDASRYAWVDDARALADRDDLDVIVEMIGGSEGLARELVTRALEAGKHVVTANKALLAHHGAELAALAEQNDVSLNYEAAVAGGIPIIKALREGFAGNEIHAVFGILNGTCNYMLTAMRETGRDFEVILKEAQEAGYAEADPSFDVDGIDAGHKLAIMAAIAFGVKPDFAALPITGIRNIVPQDIYHAEELGYRIKLLGMAKRLDGKLMQSMEPCLVPKTKPLGVIEDVFNAVYVDGDAVDTPFLTGRGAGEGPTASAVMSDIIDIARGICVPTFGIPAQNLKTASWADLGDTVSQFYLRLMVTDKKGVIADISGILRDHDISIEDLVQHGGAAGEVVAVILTTHEVALKSMKAACEALQKLEAVVDEPCLMRIEELE